MGVPWNAAYRDWTGEDLVLCNYLRPNPLTYRELASYAGHKIGSLQVIANTLRRAGRLTHDNVVLIDHPDNQPARLRDHLSPLPDPRRAISSTSFSHLQNVETARAIADTPDADLPTLDKAKAAKILAAWITTGQAGKDTPRFMTSWLELISTTQAPGPPPPTTSSATRARLLRLFRCLPAPDVHAAYSAFLTQPHEPASEVPLADPPSAGEAPPPPGGHLESPPQPPEALDSPDDL